MPTAFYSMLRAMRPSLDTPCRVVVKLPYDGSDRSLADRAACARVTRKYGSEGSWSWSVLNDTA
jgi:hypothetical protein